MIKLGIIIWGGHPGFFFNTIIRNQKVGKK